MTSEQRVCQACKNQFTIEPEDFDFYTQMQVPPPTWCWLCRAQRRLLFRNERYLYKRKSAKTGKDIFSTYAPDIPYTVYENEAWYADDWDDLATGKDIDWSRPFLEQVRELIPQCPTVARALVGGVNSDYVNNATDPKNCYLVFNSTAAEDSAYSNGIDFSQNCIDCSHITKCQLCYGSFWLIRCSKAFYSSQCEDSSDIYFSKNLKGCTNCFGCVNLRSKSYYIFNKPYSKEEYFKEIEKYDLSSAKVVEELKKKAQDLWRQFPVRYIQGIQNENVSGEYINHSRNVRYSYFVTEGENLKYCQYLLTPSAKDCYDYSLWGPSVNFAYEVCQTGHGSNNLKFCVSSWINVHDMEYTFFSQSSSYLFGCVGLRNKQYCILNRQYAKEEYEELIPKIKKHMDEMPYVDNQKRIYKYGEFFPPEFSPFAYNEAVVQDQFPLTKEEALAQGYMWRDAEDRQLSVDVKASDLPDILSEVSDDILNKVIECAHEGTCNDQCTKAFRLTPQELEFYRRLQIPLPRLCFRCRTAERLAQRARLNVYERTCMCQGAGQGTYVNTTSHYHGEGVCETSFKTNISPDRSEIVYCDSCYQAEVS